MGSDEDRYVLIAILERFLDLSVYSGMRSTPR